MPVSRVVVRVEKAAGCPLARRRSPCRWRRNCRSCHREQSSKGPISSLRPQKGGAGASRSLAYWRGIRAGKMLTIAGSWFKSAGPRVGCGTHPGCTRWLAISRASKAVRCQAEGARGLRRGSGLPGRGVVGHDHLCQRRRWRKGWWRAFGGRSALFCDALPALGERSSDDGRCC